MAIEQMRPTHRTPTKRHGLGIHTKRFRRKLHLGQQSIDQFRSTIREPAPLLAVGEVHAPHGQIQLFLQCYQQTVRRVATRTRSQ